MDKLTEAVKFHSLIMTIGEATFAYVFRADGRDPMEMPLGEIRERSAPALSADALMDDLLAQHSAGRAALAQEKRT